MYEWTEAFDRLRTVRTARDEFAVRFMVDRFIIGPMLLDRLADELHDNGESVLDRLQRRSRSADES